MHELKIDFDYIFTDNNSSSSVVWFELDEEKAEIKGTVRGSGDRIHHTDILLGVENEIHPGVPFRATCGCPVGTHCKHVLALFRSAVDRYGAEKLNALMEKAEGQSLESNPLVQMLNQIVDARKTQGKRKTNKSSPPAATEPTKSYNSFTLEDDGSIRGPAGKSSQSVELERQRKDWFRNLEALSNSELKSQKGKATSSCVLYFLEQNYNRDISAGVYLSKHLKRGGFGTPTSYRGMSNCLRNNKWPVSFSESDKHILNLAQASRAISTYYGEISLLGTEGFELLQKILATGRCMVNRHLMFPIQPGKSIEGEIRWSIAEDGLQRPNLIDASTQETLELIPTNPPLYLKQTPGRAECGELRQMPSTELLRTLLKAPPLDDLGIEETTRTLPSLIKGEDQKAVNLPRKLHRRLVQPDPVLVLDGVRSADKSTPIARAQLFFLYDSHRVKHGGPLSSIEVEVESEDHLVIPRQATQENSLRFDLPPHMKSVHISDASDSNDQVARSILQNDDLIMGFDGEEYRRHWVHFMNNERPKLEKQGWLFEITDSFPFQFETLADSDWYAELDESDMDWFTLRLGINIDGKPIDLLPLLARQIHQLPTLDKLQRMKKNSTVPVALANGKFVILPAERLCLILGTLLELFGDRSQEEYRIQPHHAQIWEELYNELDLPWAGSEKLLELSRKLKNFKKLKNVNPANTLQADLRPYQLHGLSWLQFLREYNLNGILADDMGLGKTLQTLAHLQLEKQRLSKQGEILPPSLVVSPTSLIHNWTNEATKFTPDLNVHIHHGSDRDAEAINEADLVLTSYGVIQRDLEELSKTRFHLLALDEAQAIKNPNAKVAKSIRCLQADHKVCLTGTPMENHLGELWSLFDFLMPGFLGGRDQFTRFYRTPIEKKNNQEQAKRLQRRVAPFMLRRSKDLVAKELPPKTEIIRTVELSGQQRDLYETIRASMEARVKSEIEKKGFARSQIAILDALLKMRQVCCDPSLVKLEQAKTVQKSAKLDILMELVQTMVEEDRKILIFSQFTSMLSLIEQRLESIGIPWAKLTGQTQNRKQPVQDFQNGEIPVFLISLKAGGTGLNLTAADTVIHYDPWWNPAVEDQASDRAHRIGQNKPVFVYKLVTEGTVEEKIQELKEKKKNIATSLYGGNTGKKKQSITVEDLGVLFEPLKPAPE
ncbi:MAG: SNF2-related protein [Endozoicomonas sp.]